MTSSGSYHEGVETPRTLDEMDAWLRRRGYTSLDIDLRTGVVRRERSEPSEGPSSGVTTSPEEEK